MAQKKNWEKQARKSRHSAFLTFLGAAAVIGALLISFWQLTSLQNQINDKQAQLAEINGNIEKAQMELDDLLDAMADSVKNVDQGAEQVVQRTAGDVRARYNLLKQETAADLEEMAKVEKKSSSVLKKKPKTPPAETEPVPTSRRTQQSAFIEGEDNFVVSRSVESRMPVGISDTFEPGNVYVWARVKAPKKESLIIRWLDANKKVLRTQYLRVQQNMGDGYRVYDYKSFSEDQKGKYAVLLFNENGDLIARKSFTIS